MSSILASYFPGYGLNKHDSTVADVVKLNAVFMAVTTLVIGLRIFVRIRILKHTGVDDILMGSAGMFALAFSAMCILATKYGLGHHEWDLDPTKVMEINKKCIQILWIAQVMYSTALNLVKSSLIATYVRIFYRSLPFRYTMFTTLTACVLVWICSILVTIFQCRPISGAWDFTKPRHCIQVANFYYFSTAFSILTDLMLCTLPVPLFWRLKLPQKEKVVVCALFGVGMFASVASILRITELSKLLSMDITAEAVPVVNWSVVELGVGIICACIPSLKPLFKMWMPRLFSSARFRAMRRLPVGRAVGRLVAGMGRVREVASSRRWSLR